MTADAAFGNQPFLTFAIAMLMAASFRNGLNTELIPYETQKEYIEEYVMEIIDKEDYDIDPALILAMVETESTYKWQVSNGPHYGLMQINPQWQHSRMEEFGVEDIRANPYENLVIGIDYIYDLYTFYGDEISALNAYNSGSPQGGRETGYAKAILTKRRRIQHEMWDKYEGF